MSETGRAQVADVSIALLHQCGSIPPLPTTRRCGDQNNGATSRTAQKITKMKVEFTGIVFEGDEAIKRWTDQNGAEQMSRTGVITTLDEPAHISFYSRGVDDITRYPLTVGQKVKIVVDERDSKNQKGWWNPSRRLVSVEYLN